MKLCSEWRNSLGKIREILLEITESGQGGTSLQVYIFIIIMNFSLVNLLKETMKDQKKYQIVAVDAWKG